MLLWAIDGLDLKRSDAFLSTNIRVGSTIFCLLITFISSQAYATGVANFNYAPKIESHYPKEISGVASWGNLDTKKVRGQDRLIRVADSYARLKYVPYIWGGGQVGSKKNCLACRKCVRSKKIALKNRLSACKPCQRCGIDCSHFVNMVYREAGLPYNYASTWELTHQSSEGLLDIYDLVDLGTNLFMSRPGDLLVYEKHMVMLVQTYRGGYGDFVHATRFRGGDKLNLGGFRWDKNRNLKKLRGKLIRVLRHKAFFESWADIERFRQASLNSKRSYMNIASQLKNLIEQQ